MELPLITAAAIVVFLVWRSTRPKRRRPGSSATSALPKLWHTTPGTDSYAWFGGSNAAAGSDHHGSDSGHFHEGGYHSSTNSFSDGGGYDGGGGGGGDGGGGDG